MSLPEAAVPISLVGTPSTELPCPTLREAALVTLGEEAQLAKTVASASTDAALIGFDTDIIINPELNYVAEMGSHLWRAMRPRSTN